MYKTIIFLAALFLLTSCDVPQQQPKNARAAQAEQAQRIADSQTYTDNYEQQNIEQRRKLFSKPGKVGYIVLLDSFARPVASYVIDGKPTSSGKRLSRPWDMVRCDTGGGVGGDCVVEAPSDEGLWGSSSPYIYFFTAQGVYVQWSGNYVYQDQPIRLTEKPLIIEAQP